MIAEYDGNNNLKFWRLGNFGHKTKESGATSYYYLKDHIGNIRATVNESGTIVTKDDYYPFGLQMEGFSYNNGNDNDRIKYSGKELDEEAGLSKYHFGWRDYDPELGRWHAVDPARQFASPYVFNANNPVNLYDPDGRKTTWGPISELNMIQLAILREKQRYLENLAGGAGNGWGADGGDMLDDDDLMTSYDRGRIRDQQISLQASIDFQIALAITDDLNEESEDNSEEMPTIIDQSTIPFLYSTKAYMRQEGVGIHAIFSVEGNVYITVFSNGAQLIKIAAIGSSSANMMGKTEWSALATLTDSKGNTLSTRGFQVFPGPSISSAGIDNRSTYLGTASFTTTMNSSFNNSHNVNVNVGYLYSSPEGQAASPRLEFTIYIP